MSSNIAAHALYELGTLVGRRQAFGLIANKCSAADAECLKQIRDAKTYQDTGLTWEEFCPRHLGISRSHADRIIQQLEEFGAAYFQLSEFVRIPEEAYRAIAPAVGDDAIEYNGEHIPIIPENRHRIAEVVSALRRQAEQARPQPHPQDSLPRLRARLDRWLGQLAAASADPAGRMELIEYGRQRLAELSGTLRQHEPAA